MLEQNYKVTAREIDTLTPYAKNSRVHSERQIEQIAASIKEFGFTNPVIVDEHDNIVAGHGRVLAAKLLGMEAVPCITVRGWTDAQRRAYVIADNRLAETADWDFQIMIDELTAIDQMGFDLMLTGFDKEEIDVIMNGGEAYDPSLNPLSDGHVVSGEDMNNARHKMDAHTKEVNDKREAGIVTVICPHCFEEFTYEGK